MTEGIEDAQTLAIVRDLGFDQVQVHQFSPVSAEIPTSMPTSRTLTARAFEAWLAQPSTFVVTRSHCVAQ